MGPPFSLGSSFVYCMFFLFAYTFNILQTFLVNRTTSTEEGLLLLGACLSAAPFGRDFVSMDFHGKRKAWGFSSQRNVALPKGRYADCIPCIPRHPVISGEEQCQRTPKHLLRFVFWFQTMIPTTYGWRILDV